MAPVAGLLAVLGIGLVSVVIGVFIIRSRGPAKADPGAIRDATHRSNAGQSANSKFDPQAGKGQKTLAYWNNMRSVMDRDEPGAAGAAKEALFGNHAAAAKLIRKRIAGLQAVPTEGVDEEAVFCWKKRLAIMAVWVVLLNRADEALRTGDGRLGQLRDQIANAPPRPDGIDYEQERVRRVLCKRYKLDFGPLLPEMADEQLDEDRVGPIAVQVSPDLQSVVVQDIEVDDRTGFRRFQAQIGNLFASGPLGPVHVLPGLYLTPEAPRTVVKVQFTCRKRSLSRNSLFCTFRNQQGREIAITLATHPDLKPGVPAEVLMECAGAERPHSVGLEPPPVGVVRRMKGHRGAITALALSKDQRFALSAGKDNTIRMWDLATGKEVRSFKGNSDPVSCLAISPDNRFVLSGSGGTWLPRRRPGTALRLWDVETGQDLRRFQGYTTPVHSVGFSPDGRHVLSSGGEVVYSRAGAAELIDCTVHLWDVATGEERRRFGDKDESPKAAFSPDGRYVLSVSVKGVARVWEVASGRLRLSFERDPEVLSSSEAVAFSPDGGSVVSVGTWERGIIRRTWAVGSGRLTRRERVDGPTSSLIALSPDTRRGLFASGSDHDLVDIATGKGLWHSLETVHCVAFSSDGRFLLVGLEELSAAGDTPFGVNTEHNVQLLLLPGE
jgi:WD40 repeat protein